MFLHSNQARASRRAWPIHGYVGPNGGGKSAAMVWDTLPTLAAGRQVLSTVRLLDYANPRDCEGCDLEAFHQTGPLLPGGAWPRHRQAHPLWVPLRSWEQMLDAVDCDVLLDEVTGVASSREHAAMPAPVANKLVQLRRSDVVVRWTAPSWARADKIIRECSQAVTHCRGSWSKAVVDEDGERQWRTRRLFRWKTYDADAFEDFTAGKREQLQVESREWHWGPGSPAWLAYDTFDAVSAIATVTDSGRCYRCGGRRSVPTCKCDSHGVAEGAEVGRGLAPAPGGPRVVGSGDGARPARTNAADMTGAAHDQGHEHVTPQHGHGPAPERQPRGAHRAARRPAS